MPKVKERLKDRTEEDRKEIKAIHRGQREEHPHQGRRIDQCAEIMPKASARRLVDATSGTHPYAGFGKRTTRVQKATNAPSYIRKNQPRQRQKQRKEA